MRKFSLLFIGLVVLFFAGCNQEQTDSVKMINDTYHKVPTGYSSEAQKFKTPREDKENELLLANMKKQEAIEIAQIEAKSSTEIKRIETEAFRAKIVAEKEAKLNAQQTQKEISAVQYQTQKDIANSNQKVTLQTQEKDLYLYRIIIGVVTLLVLLILLLLYLAHRKNKAVELKIEEDKLKHEQYMQSSNQYHEKTNKMLEIIADKNSDKHVKKELIRILRYQDQNQALIPVSLAKEDVVETTSL